MSKEEYKKLVSIEINKFINKRIEIRRIYIELLQSKNNISYLKEKYKQACPEELNTEKGTLSIKKYKSEFSNRLKKEFKDFPVEEKRKLVKSGLLRILFRLNSSEYEKLKKEKQKTPLDDYAIKRHETQSYSWVVKISEKTKKELEEFELKSKEFQDLKNLDVKENVKEKVNKSLDKIERERDLNKDYIEQKIENERQFYQQLSDEIDSTPYVSYFTDDAPDETTPDVYEEIMDDLVKIEEEDEDDK